VLDFSPLNGFVIADPVGEERERSRRIDPETRLEMRQKIVASCVLAHDRLYRIVGHWFQGEAANRKFGV